LLGPIAQQDSIVYSIGSGSDRSKTLKKGVEFDRAALPKDIIICIINIINIKIKIICIKNIIFYYN
jgi:hypothetical protein